MKKKSGLPSNAHLSQIRAGPFALAFVFIANSHVAWSFPKVHASQKIILSRTSRDRCAEFTGEGPNVMSGGSRFIELLQTFRQKGNPQAFYLRDPCKQWIRDCIDQTIGKHGG